jgi:tRNA(Arg) A34 adenosine deaminase TadA
VLAEGVNDSRRNPVLHGEIVCINAYVAAHGNVGWEDAVLYTTAEPARCACPRSFGPGSAAWFTHPRWQR